jgi:hypothetical protein
MMIEELTIKQTVVKTIGIATLHHSGKGLIVQLSRQVIIRFNYVESNLYQLRNR